jgi:hypothetical protein
MQQRCDVLHGRMQILQRCALGLHTWKSLACTCKDNTRLSDSKGLSGAAGSRQASKLRQRYLQAVLRQEPAYFDVHTTTGELLQGLNDDTSAIQMAIGEKVLACSAAC